MQKYKKHQLEKNTEGKELFLKNHPSEDGEILYECHKAFESLVQTYSNALHGKLFGEESDFIYDSGVDANIRKRGENPMREEYQEKVDAKRIALGFEPLAKNGMAVDGDKTMQYCKEKVLALLCKKV